MKLMQLVVQQTPQEKIGFLQVNIFRKIFKKINLKKNQILNITNNNQILN